MSLPVRIASNATDKIVCYNQSVELTCHVDDIDVIEYKWTSTKLKQPKKTTSIIVIATDELVEYTCQVIGDNGKNGKSSVTVSSNGEL